MKIQNVHDETFRKYGKILSGYALDEICTAMQQTPCPEDVIYIASDESLEALPIAGQLKEEGFGGMEIQIGYCNGHNQKLNALEYHRNSEINIAAEDMILLLGLQTEINTDGTFDTAKTEAFLVPAGTAVEIYATTLHYAPCGINGSGFRCVVVLPKGTNTDLDFIRPDSAEGALMTARNKWLLAHPDAGIPDVKPMLYGENISI